jgi:tRNA pseudouridine55 synthase
VDGKRAYERARAGEEVNLPPRPVTIHELELEAFEGDRAVISMRCSSGTYVRSLARDLGRAAGSCASLSALERSSIGPFTLESAVSAEEFDPQRDLGRLDPELAAALGLRTARLPDSAFRSFQNGGVVGSAALEELSPRSGCPTAVFDSKGDFIGLVDASGERLVYQFVVRKEA